MHPSLTRTSDLVLASSSRYRREILAKLGIPFVTATPEIDEAVKPTEKPDQLALRLARQKAQALAQRFPRHLIIGSDQVAMLDGQQLTKPGDRDRAIAQLRAASGRAVEFFTAVCVLDSATGTTRADLDKTVVRFRPLTDAMIEAYVDRDRPFDCAGGFKSESLGVVLFETIETEDPNALVGLPLLRLIRLLEGFGVDVLSAGNN
jgi:septum formation protein